MRETHIFLVGKCGGKKLLGRQARTNENNIINLEVGSGELDSSGSGQGPVTCSSEHGNENLDFIKGRGIS
jgi:hypothetical protein